MNKKHTGCDTELTFGGGGVVPGVRVNFSPVMYGGVSWMDVRIAMQD